MKYFLKFLFYSMIIMGVIISCASINNPETGFVIPLNNNRYILFDSGWLFYRGDVSDAEQSSFNDEGWCKINLPHDWSMEIANPILEEPDAEKPFVRI
jgi:hypothetical protein